jgi:hypothetical protein
MTGSVTWSSIHYRYSLCVRRNNPVIAPTVTATSTAEMAEMVDEMVTGVAVVGSEGESKRDLSGGIKLKGTIGAEGNGTWGK